MSAWIYPWSITYLFWRWLTWQKECRHTPKGKFKQVFLTSVCISGLPKIILHLDYFGEKCKLILKSASLFYNIVESESEVTQSCPTLCDPVDCSLPGSSVHGILQERILEWVASSFSSGSSWPRDRTQVSRIAGRCFNLWATREEYLNTAKSG